MYLMKEKQGGPIPTGPKRWLLMLIKHLADTTCISPSPAGPAGCCPLNLLYLLNLKFRVRAPNGCCILSLGGTVVREQVNRPDVIGQVVYKNKEQDRS